MNDFELHPRLVKDTFAVANLNLCKLLLMNDSNYPWFILVPRIKNISELLTPENINAEVEIVYQSIEGLHNACPNHKGDWYFTGNYPTPGGNRVINRAFIYYVEGIDKLAY